MSASDKSRIPVGKFGWLILVAVVAAPTAFFLLVTPKEPDAPPASPVAKRPLTKLEAVGLRDYRDWDGLPEIFAVWADKAHWEKDRTRFAYWNPANRSYSYFFEARRTAKGYRFREIPEPRDDTFTWYPEASEDVPLRLFVPKDGALAVSVSRPDGGTLSRPAPEKVDVQLDAPKLEPAAPKRP